EDDRQAPGPLRLEVRGLCSAHFHDISFSVHAGEVVGLAGLVGAGRSEVARAIFGADPYTQGELILEGRRVRFKHPSEAIAHGLAMVPEDRKLLSLFMDMPIIFNIMMAE